MKLKAYEENDIEEEISEDDKKSEFEVIRKELVSRLEFVGMMYERQAESIPKRIGKRKSDMYTRIAIFIAVVLADTFITILLNAPGGAVLGFAIEVWIAVIYLFVAIIKTGYDAIIAIFTYMVHSEKKSCMNYINNHDIFTLKAEQRYCAEQEKKVRDLLYELKKADCDMSYEKYQEIEYVEKRADWNVCDGYGLKDVLIIVGFIVVLIIIFM